MGDLVAVVADTGPGQAKASMRFRITGWAAEAPGLYSKEQWAAWSRGDAIPVGSERSGADLPMMLRRRLGSLGQMAARAIADIGLPATARYVFCSRHGDFKRTVRLLESLAKREPLSPAEFGMSVHNAIAGILSIASGNGAGHTAIAAGPDSFGEGMIEALGSVMANPDEPVLLAYFDEPLPTPYERWRDSSEMPLALAIGLAPAVSQSPAIELSLEPRPTGMTPDRAASQPLDFLRFLLAGEGETLSWGVRMGWRWRHVAG